jgi:hypothetical protein
MRQILLKIIVSSSASFSASSKIPLLFTSSFKMMAIVVWRYAVKQGAKVRDAKFYRVICKFSDCGFCISKPLLKYYLSNLYETRSNLFTFHLSLFTSL